MAYSNAASATHIAGAGPCAGFYYFIMHARLRDECDTIIKQMCPVFLGGARRSPSSKRVSCVLVLYACERACMTTEVKAPLHSGATCQEVSAVRKGRDDQLERCWKGSSAASDTVVPLVRKSHKVVPLVWKSQPYFIYVPLTNFV